MQRIWMSGAAALAMMVGAMQAHAGGPGGGVPVEDPGDGCALTESCDVPGGGGDDGSGGGDTGTGTGGGTGTPNAPLPLPYTYGSGAKLFTLDTLPTNGPGGTQIYFQPVQAGIPGAPQDALFQTVGGLTVSFHTDAFDGTGAATSIRTDNDSLNFPYLGVPSGVQVGILATAFGGPAGPIYVNFTNALSYFSINLYRLSGAFDVNSQVQAYSGLDGTGSLLGSTTGSIAGGNNFAFTTVELANLAGARSFKLNGTFLSNYDDITVTEAPAAVPEPASWAMMVGGFGLIGGAMRRRRAIVRFV